MDSTEHVLRAAFASNGTRVPPFINVPENALVHIFKGFEGLLRRPALRIALKSQLLPLPFLILTDSPDGIWGRLFNDHPEHDSCCSRQGIPKQFCVSILELATLCLAHIMVTGDTQA